MKTDKFVVLFWAKIITLFVGIVLSVVYQFTGVGACLLCGLAFFACSFFLIALTEIMNLVVVRTTVIEEQTPEKIEQKKKEIANKTLFVSCRMLLAFGMGVFAVVVIFLF